VPGQPDSDVLEIVLPCPVNDQFLNGHNRPSLAGVADGNKCSLSSPNSPI